MQNRTKRRSAALLGALALSVISAGALAAYAQEAGPAAAADADATPAAAQAPAAAQPPVPGQPPTPIPVTETGMDKAEFREVINSAKARVFPAVVFIKCVSENFDSGKKVTQESS